MPPVIKADPVQSMLRRPAMKGVFADSIFRKKMRIAREIPPIGTIIVSKVTTH